MKKDQVAEELPEAANQKAIEKKLRELLGPPPQEATTDEIMESRGIPSAKRAEVVPKDPTTGEVIILPGDTNLESSVAQEIDNMPLPKASPEVEAPEAINEVPEDKTTSEAVDDIVAKESDVVLEAEDAEVAAAFKPENPSSGPKFRQFISRLWSDPISKWLIILTLVGLVTAVGAVPSSRYFILNNVGVRASVSLSVIDDTSQQPLKNIQVSISSQAGLTDGDGKVSINHVKLGKQTLLIQKRAYADTNKVITVGWGSNPLGSFSLKATGSQYTIIVKDFLSGLPVDSAEAGVGEAISTADKTGKILLAVDPGSDKAVVVSINAKTYRSEKITLTLSSKAEQKVTLVPARKDVFISKRSGKYDLYKIDVDGKNETLVLAGTGAEQDNLVLSSHPTDEVVAYVSTRDNAHNKDGFLLSTLLLINLADNSSKSLIQSERVQLVGWSGDRIVYLQIVAGASAFSPKRYRLMSYDYITSDKRELASGNYFNDALLVGNVVYFAPAGLSQNDGSSNFSKINVDGSGKLTILNKTIWSISRTTYDKFVLSVDQDWYDYKLGTSTASKLSGQPSGLKSYLYTDSPDKKHSLWVDNRDGKGVLLAYDTIAKTDKILATQSGLVNVVRWLSDNTVVYRIHTDQETADYVLNIDGGVAKKIKDVTNTISLEQGYY